MNLQEALKLSKHVRMGDLYFNFAIVDSYLFTYSDLISNKWEPVDCTMTFVDALNYSRKTGQRVCSGSAIVRVFADGSMDCRNMFNEHESLVCHDFAHQIWKVYRE